MSGNTAELESLLVGPYLWSGFEYFDFFHDVAKLVSDAGSKQVFGTRDFVQMMGVQYWDIFKRNDKGKDQYNLDSIPSKKRSLVLLLKVIRDKCEHIHQYKDTVKEQLNTLNVNGKQFEFFHKDLSGKYHRSEHQFSAFWISKFPKLVPYLWQELYKSKKELQKYYPYEEINIKHFRKTKLDLTGYVEGLSNALTCDMENGNLFRRFKGQGGCSLEFRGFLNLDKVRDKNKVVIMAINPGTSVVMSVSHSSSFDEVMEYIGNAPGTEKLILIFAANITDDEVWKKCKSVDCRIVIFCDPDRLTTEKIKEAVDTFKTKNNINFELSDSPIKGYELSNRKQSWVFERGQVVVQKREINIKDIFSNSSSMSGILSGNLLNKLLKREKPTLFGNYKYPKYKGVYIERKLSLSQNVNDEQLGHIYVAVNSHLDGLLRLGCTQVFNNIRHLEDKRANVKSDCEFILLKDQTCISDEIIAKCDPAFCPRIVRFLDADYFNEYPTNSRVARYPAWDKKVRRGLAETEFLKIIRPKNIKTFFFRAESGMGKSKLLISLGKRLENSLLIFCAFKKFVDILQENVGTTDCTKIDIKRVILEILGCKDKCEIHVIYSWLDQKGDLKTRVELQLDSLDEVPSKHLKLALRALKIIENDFDSVRLWITSSLPFPSEMEEIQFVEWHISPFEYSDKVSFFTQCWERTGEQYFTTGIENFVDCLLRKIPFNNTNELTDYPLFCSMIVELSENNCALPTSFNRLHLYEYLVKKKFAVKIKKKIGKEPVETDNDFKMVEEIYMHAHKYFSLAHLFPELSNQFNKPSAMKFLTEENFFEMRIITSIQPPSFVHGSYAHYFVAWFIVDGIRTGELDNLCEDETFDNILLSGRPDKSNLNMITLLWQLVNSYLGEVKDWSSLKWLENRNKAKHCNIEYSSTFLTYLIVNDLWELARLLIHVHKSKMGSDECNKILHMAISQNATSKWVIEMCEKLSIDNQKELLICSVQNGNYETAKYLIDTCFVDGNKVFDEIAEIRAGGIFHCIVDLISKASIKIGQRNFVKETKEFINFVHKRNPEEINRKDNLGQNLLLALPLLHDRDVVGCLGKILSLKKFLVEELKADVNERSSDGKSVMSLGHVSRTRLLWREIDILECAGLYHETLACVESKGFAHINLKCKITGLTPVEEAVHFFGQNLKKETLTLFRDLGANFNELDEDGYVLTGHDSRVIFDVFFKIL